VNVAVDRHAELARAVEVGCPRPHRCDQSAIRQHLRAQVLEDADDHFARMSEFGLSAAEEGVHAGCRGCCGQTAGVAGLIRHRGCDVLRLRLQSASRMNREADSGQRRAQLVMQVITQPDALMVANLTDMLVRSGELP